VENGVLTLEGERKFEAETNEKNYRRVERSYGNAVVDRGPWLLSVGIPTRLAVTRVAPLLPATPSLLRTAGTDRFPRRSPAAIRAGAAGR